MIEAAEETFDSWRIVQAFAIAKLSNKHNENEGGQAFVQTSK